MLINNHNEPCCCALFSNEELQCSFQIQHIKSPRFIELFHPLLIGGFSPKNWSIKVLSTVSYPRVRGELMQYLPERWLWLRSAPATKHVSTVFDVASLSIKMRMPHHSLQHYTPQPHTYFSISASLIIVTKHCKNATCYIKYWNWYVWIYTVYFIHRMQLF